ncbi:MAG: hypothetical protein IKZ90_08465 [Clostridiales bacterium]|nr:hypothetical protein [Clostridiales bacterium]
MTGRAGKAALLYFFIHFMLEVVCFFMLYRIIGDPVFISVVATIYNAVAFVPQLLFGSLRDLLQKFHPGIVGVPFLLSGFLLYFILDATGILFWVSLVLLCIGNALVHISGAELTIRTSGGKLSPVAIFVSGGSFGLITGQVLAGTGLSFWWIALTAAIMMPLVIIGETLYKGNPEENEECSGFNYTVPKRVAIVVIAAAFVIVTIRSYVGYGIPVSWKTTLVEAVLLYVFMGIGKALGGILSDTIGIRKTAFISIIGAMPFLVFGDRIMIISLIGIMFFSMTMPVALGMILSVLKISPGAAFGVTTVGLFMGTVIAAYLKTDSLLMNCMIIVLASAVCFLLAHYILRPDKEEEDYV